MMRRLLLSLGIATALVAPVTALAEDPMAPILSPEEALLNDALSGGGYINPRLASKISDIQYQRFLQSRQERLVAQQSSSSEAPTVVATTSSSSAPVTVQIDTSGLQSAAPVLSAADLRALERIHRNQMIASLYGDLPSLHRGAPLAPSGAGTWVMLSVAMAGVALTLWKAKRMGISMKFWK